MMPNIQDRFGRLRAALPACVVSLGCFPLLTACVEPASDEAPDEGSGGSGGSNEPTPPGGSGSDNSSGADSGGDPGFADSGMGSSIAFSCESEAAPGDMVPVAAGEFTMGCDETADEGCADDELPPHGVSLSAFEIDRSEVTQDQYAACVGAGACEVPSCTWNCELTNYPASCISWSQAKTYCAWVDKRLPTEAEWEKAARGEQGATYPWGDAEPDCMLANLAGCVGAPMPVGMLEAGASPYGALDMAGNMVEMVADWYDETYYASSPTEDPIGPETGTRYGGRGGGYSSEGIWLRAAKRDWYDLSDWAPALGFRCAR